MHNIKERVTAQIDTFNLEPSEWLADKGYGHGPTYEFLKSRKITAYIPLRDNKLGAGKNAPTKDFKYNRKEDIYVCPAGNKMYPHTPTESFTRYVTKNRECFTCPLRETCMATVSKTRTSKYVNRSIHQDTFEQMHRRQKTKHFKFKLKQRAWKIEGVFSELKENHSLGRAQYRGRINMQIQMYMIACVHNLKRLTGKPRTVIFDFFMRFWTVTERQNHKMTHFFKA